MREIQEKNLYDIVIIGAGASGLFAASNIKDKKVLIIEHNNEIGKKLKITGGGRCNIFNADYDIKSFLKNYSEAEKYLYTPFSIFSVQNTKEYFENIGIKIKVEDRNRAFPISEKASDVYEALYKKALENKVEFRLNTKLIDIILKDNNEDKNEKNNEKNNENNLKEINYIKVLNLKTNNEEKIKAKKYILATGGISHPYTGSTGDGFKILKKLNIDIKEASSDLVPIIIEDSWIKKISGKTLKDVKLTFFVDDEKVKVINNKTTNTDQNINILCTHFGLSGPSIINNSKNIKEWLQEGNVTCSIDLFKDKNEKDLDNHILNIFDNNKNKKLKNILNEIYPNNILEEIFLDENNNLDDIDLEQEVNNIKKSERRKIVNVLKNLKIKIINLMPPENSIVANGGVELSEINFKDFSLLKIPNLHVTGDLLNITRPSGGFSLQLCWTSGYLASL